jgi:predicted flap endonuclease-1-like 5' DNA nuclease/predicted regulator of Ras-like GTPase activity (Roadblock/LC7/MglB family)
MARKKRKSEEASLEEQEKPEIPLEFSEEEINESSDALEKAEALTRRIRAMIQGPDDAPSPAPEDEPESDKKTPLSEIDGIGPAYQRTLKEHGILSIQMLLAADAESLAEKTKFSAETIREWQDKGHNLVGDADVDTEEPEQENLAEAEVSEEPEERHKADKPDAEEKTKQSVERIKSKEGVVGYILRNATSASVDLKDPTKIVDYAVLSSSTLEAGDEISNTFNLGEVRHVFVEGNTVKLISLTIGDSKVSVFMEKPVDHKQICKELLG